MTTCAWCGDTHGPDKLCRRAQSSMTRRSFCFLFGAGLAGLALDPTVAYPHEWPTEGVITIGDRIRIFPFSKGLPIHVPVLLESKDYWVSTPHLRPSFGAIEFTWTGELDKVGRAVYRAENQPLKRTVQVPGGRGAVDQGGH